MNARELTSWLASICTIALWLTGVPTCKKIYHQGNTANVPFFPFLCMFCGSTLWMKYGLVKHDSTLTLVNSTGALINLVFILVYYVYTYHKNLLHKQLIGGCLLLFPVLIYVKYYVHTPDLAIERLGLYCSCLSVLSYGSPLASLVINLTEKYQRKLVFFQCFKFLSCADICKTKSTEFLSFSLAFANFVVALEWWYYGVLMGDIYVKIPNMLGTILGVIQLSLFCMYPRKKTIPSTSASNVIKT